MRHISTCYSRFKQSFPHRHLFFFSLQVNKTRKVQHVVFPRNHKVPLTEDVGNHKRSNKNLLPESWTEINDHTLVFACIRHTCVHVREKWLFTDGTVCSDVSCITAYRDSMYILSAIAFLTAFANYGRQTTGQPWDASLFHHPPEAAWIIEGRGKERETRKRSKNKRRRRALTVSEMMLMSFNCVRWVTAADEPSWR